MKQRPLILITNDDGIDSPGLHAAAEALMPIAEILITAPAEQQSGTGRSFRSSNDAVFQSKSIKINGSTVEGWYLDASPATTVRHALQCLVNDRKPDMIVSGINFGENIGSNVTASGTVGAAIQGAAWGYKALAVSLEVPEEYHYNYGIVDWSHAISIVHKAAVQFLTLQWPEDVHIVKIDIPDTADSTTPWKASRLSMEPGWWGYVPQSHPKASAGTTIGKRGPRPGHQWEEDGDGGVLMMRREVSITPLSIDMTSRIDLSRITAMLPDNT